MTKATYNEQAMLSKKQIQDYQEQGFIVLDQIIAAEQIESIKKQAAIIVEQWVEDSPSNVFTTKDNDRSGDTYFLESAEKIRCFFEEEAFSKTGQLVQERALSINKIGHALHELDPIFEAFSHQSLLGDIAEDLGLQQPQIRQSMYIFKQNLISQVKKFIVVIEDYIFF